MNNKNTTWIWLSKFLAICAVSSLSIGSRTAIAQPNYEPTPRKDSGVLAFITGSPVPTAREYVSCDLASESPVGPWALFNCMLSYRPVIYGSIAQVHIAESNRDASKSVLWPKLGATLGRGVTGGSGESIGQLSGSSRYNIASLSASYRVFDFGSSVNAIAMSEHEASLARLRSQQVRNELAADLLKYYFSTAMTAEAVDKLRKRVDLLSMNVASQARRLNVGAASKADLGSATVALANARVELLETQADLDLYRLSLASLVGLSQADQAILSIGSLDNFAFDNWERNIDFYLDGHPDIRIKQIEALKMRASIKLAKAEMLPTIDVSLGVQKNTTASQVALNGGRSEATGAITLNVPIFSGFEQLSRVRSASHQYEAALAGEAEARVLLNAELRRLAFTIRNALATMTIRRNIGDEVQSLVDSAARRANLGESLAIELVSYKVSRLDADLAYLRAMGATFQHFVEFWRKAGLAEKVVTSETDFFAYCPACLDPVPKKAE